MASCTPRPAATEGCTGTPEGETCACGQGPARLLSTPSCSCGGGRLDPPEHAADCRSVVWARDRNAWVAANPDVSPSLAPVAVRNVRCSEIVDPQVRPLLDSHINVVGGREMYGTSARMKGRPGKQRATIDGFDQWDPEPHSGEPPVAFYSRRTAVRQFRA